MAKAREHRGWDSGAYPVIPEQFADLRSLLKYYTIITGMSIVPFLNDILSM